MIRIYTGPMWAGKTTRMSEDIFFYEPSFHTKVYGKPALDTRDPEDVKNPHFRAREGLFLPCQLFTDKDLLDLVQYARQGCLVALDEASLHRKCPRALAWAFHEGGGELWLAGLDRTSEGLPFGEFAECFELAHEVLYLRARCNTVACKTPASLTDHRGEKRGAVKVGDAGYSPRCRVCWSDLNPEKVKNLP